MKRENRLHLSDVLTKISSIIICEDVMRSPSYISSSTDAEEDDESFYISFTDEQLLQLANSEIKRFTNPELLDRLYHAAPDKLTAEQLIILRNWYKRKVIVDAKDVEKVLELLRACTNIYYANQHAKTNAFALDSDRNLREDECIDIIHQLTLEDYVANSRSVNPSFFGNNLIIFEPQADWTTNEGTVISDLKVYIKLDLDKTTKTAVALISFHGAEYDDVYPYRK